MTADEIIAAREAFIKRGFWPNEVMWECWKDAWLAGVAAERERCARVCEEMANSRYQLKESIEIMLACADAIRNDEIFVHARQLERELAAAIASFNEERERAQREGERVIELQVKLAEAKKDAERYRLLRDHAQNTLIGVYEWVERDGRQQRAWLAGNELDDAIDAAIRKGE
jgi:hypothetical protein